MAMEKQTHSVAFFGATGGCTIAALERTIRAGIPCSALVRTPSKLTTLLTERGLTADQIEAHCTILEGNGTDPNACQRTITSANGPSSTAPASTIISGIGATPKLQWSLTQPVTLDQPNVCTNAFAALSAALRNLAPAYEGRPRPLVLAVSTTGISRRGRDVPCAILPAYKYALAVPHEDKLEMEKAVEAEMARGDRVADFAIIRPSLLSDGAVAERAKVRVGWQWFDGCEGAAKEAGPAVGYVVSRETVGRWVFEEVIKSESQGEWAGKAATITT